LKDYYTQYLSFHSRSVLSIYRSQPHLFSVKEDDFGGEVQTIHDPEDDDRPWMRMQFGFRRLEDRTVCLAVLGHDLRKLSKQEQLVWLGHAVKNASFAADDPAFERWVARNLEGSWDVEDGPRMVIQREIELISALTTIGCGSPLWRYQSNRLINYPISENTDAYYKAHLELYRLLLDGMSSETLKSLAGHIGRHLTDPLKTLSSLKELLPQELAPNVCQPLENCRAQRNRNHGGLDADPARHCPAFDSFHQDLVKLASGLTGLRSWLEQKLELDAEACLRRQSTFKHLFPKLVGPPRPELKAVELQKAVGKQITRIEFGEQENTAGIHQAEAIVLHFSDGSAMAILVGSNACNLADEIPELKASDFSTDLMVFWAPGAQRQPPR
jgi:hypothetical protein